MQDISLHIGEGELFGLIGPDGAGKTSLFRILTTLLLADSGTASVCGLDVVRDYKEIRWRVGYMPGRFSLYQDLTVEENLNFFATVFNTTVRENYDLIRDIYVQIEPFKKRKAGKLSGGMKQKLALSCALIHRPDVLFLDEPTTGLDPQTRSLLWQVVAGLRQEENLTVFLTTHYMEEAADAGYVVLLDHGRIAAEGTPLQLKNTYAHDTLTLYGVGEADVRRLGLPYAPAEQGWRVTVPDPAAAAELIRREPALFRDFELTKGRMDDVFLAVTGKKLAGGAEK